MPTFVFWNVNGKPLEDLIAGVANDLRADVLLLAECAANPAALLTRLNAHETSYFFIRNLCPRIRIYTRFAPELLRPLDEGERHSILRLSLPARKEILLATAHLPSKREFTAGSQVHECARFARLIATVEKSVSHQRTIFMGDLNVNPFEDGMVAAGGFHAVMAKDTAIRGDRTVQGQQYPFFYNPMWGRFGDLREGSPPGTFYYEKAEHLVYFWNMFDQVLLRPELASSFRPEGLSIVTKAGDASLLNRIGRPDSKAASDHLPVSLAIDF
jgi:hypothetical protein